MLANWVNGFRKRRALFGAIAALGLCTVASWLNPPSDEYLSYGNGISLPLGIPFHPGTPAQAAAYLRLLHVLYVVEPPLQGLTLVLLVGVLWSRVVRQERIVLALLLVPAFTAMLLLARGVFQVIWPHLDDPEHPIMELMLRLDAMVPYARAASAWLILLGLGGRLIRAIYRQVRRERVTT